MRGAFTTMIQPLILGNGMGRIGSSRNMNRRSERLFHLSLGSLHRPSGERDAFRTMKWNGTDWLISHPSKSHNPTGPLGHGRLRQ